MYCLISCQAPGSCGLLDPSLSCCAFATVRDFCHNHNFTSCDEVFPLLISRMDHQPHHVLLPLLHLSNSLLSSLRNDLLSSDIDFYH